MRKDSASFEKLLEGYFEKTLKSDPVSATIHGIRKAEGKLPRTGLQEEKRRQEFRLRTLKKLSSIPPTELSPEQNLDRLALRAKLLREIEDYQRGRHEIDPGAVDFVLNILLHELIRGDTEPARAAKNIHSILRKAPGYLEDSSAMLRRPEPVWLRVMQQTVEGVPSFLQALEKFLELQPGTKSHPRLLAAALKCIQNYACKAVEKKPGEAGSFAVGREILARRVRDELGLDYSLEEIEALAWSEISRINKMISLACRPFGRAQDPEKIIGKQRSLWIPPENLLNFYQDTTQSIKKAFQDSGAVTFPAREELMVKPVPDFMRHLFPTAAYSSPGAFEKEQKGIFWVNDLSVTRSTPEEKRAEQQQHFGLALTCAHEAYPGHHLQFVSSNQHRRKWRRLFSHAIFYEGWTLWCEQMMVDLKIEKDPLLQIQQLHDALWRAHRILVDLRLQTRVYSYEQAVRHLRRHLGFTKSRAEADVNWYTASPGIPMSYWLGRLENNRLKEKLVDGRGWSLKQFNDWLLSFGTIPQAWIEKYGLS